MPLCCCLTRFAAHSHLSRTFLRARNFTQWPSTHRAGRTYSAAAAEPTQEDTPWTSTSSVAKTVGSPFLAFGESHKVKDESRQVQQDGHDRSSTRPSVHGQDEDTSNSADAAARQSMPAIAEDWKRETMVTEAEELSIREEAPAAPLERTATTRKLRTGLSSGKEEMGALGRSRSGAIMKVEKGSGRRTTRVSLRMRLRTSANFSLAWTERFHQIALPYDKKQRATFLQEPSPLSFNIQVAEWVNDFKRQSLEGKVNMEAFARKRGTIGRSVWRELALWLLYHERDAVDDFLLSTNSPLYPPINWVEDCLILLARQYSLLDDGTQRSRLQKLAATFLELVPRETNEQWVFNQAFVRHILPVCSESQIDHIYRLIKIDKIKLTPYTLLHVANAFAKRNKLEQALSSLLEAKDCGANVNTVGFRSICATILRRSNQQGGLRVCLRLIENLVSMGVRLNRTLCNIVMLNAVEAGDLDTADAVHRSALEQNFELNAHTCAIRLKACKMDIHNSARLKLAIEEAIANGDIRTNAVIAGELLHCLTLQSFVDREGWEMAFKKVATACVELFDTGPMERLGLDMPEVPPNTSSTPRLTPSRHVFMYLLITYLRRGTTVEQATQLYNRWRELVEAGDKSLADCATTAHVSNVFLRRFVRSRDSLLQAAKVVKDMQKPLPRSARANQAPPDVYTWSIFLHGFASNGHTRLAEQVLRYMRSKGMEPNEVTWTSLVGGYAREQDSNGLLESMKRMQDSGIALSEWTRRGLGRFKDRGRLRGILEQQRLQQSLDFSGDLKSGLAQRLSTPPLVGQEPLAVTQGSEVQDHTVDGHHQGIFGDSPAEMAEMTTTREVENHTNPDR